jgi:hypothetical protein
LQNCGLRVKFKKTEGLKCKTCKTGPRVDFGKNRGASLQNGGGILARNYFSTDKFVDRRRRRQRGPGHGGALTGARPPAALVHQSSPAGAQKGERSTGSSTWASPELERRCGGRATAVQNREVAALGEDTAQAWRERKRSGGRCGATRGWCSPFIRAGGAPGRGGRGG